MHTQALFCAGKAKLDSRMAEVDLVREFRATWAQRYIKQANSPKDGNC